MKHVKATESVGFRALGLFLSFVLPVTGYIIGINYLIKRQHATESFKTYAKAAVAISSMVVVGVLAIVFIPYL